MTFTVAYILIAAFLLMVAATVIVSITGKGKKNFILAIYVIFFFYTIGQSFYYEKVLPGTSPDEIAHISYVVYLHDTNAVIPKFEDMHLISGMLNWSEEPWYKYIDDLTNYVCHPPLYYQIMRLSCGIEDTANYHLYSIYKTRMRHFSLGIFAIGLILLLYIGYSRISKDKPLLHLFYATAATGIPMLAFEGCAVTNDNLALVTACITILGLIRFSEKKRGYLTYILIAVGITASLLTKMTTALMCIIMAVMILFFCMLKERSIKASLKKEFFVTIPIYCFALAYFGIMYKNYGTIQPSLELICTKEYFESTVYYIDPADRVVFGSFGEFTKFYFSQFFLSWSGIVSTYGTYLKAAATTKTAMVMNVLWLFPVFILVPAVRKQNNALALPVFTGWLACILTNMLQFKSAWGVYLTRGYLGGNQARYYLPFIFALAMALSFIFTSLEQPVDGTPGVGNSLSQKNEASGFRNQLSRRFIINHILYAVAIGYTALLFYSNMPFFLLHYGATARLPF